MTIKSSELIQQLNCIQVLAKPDALKEVKFDPGFKKPSHSPSWNYLRCLRLYRANVENLKRFESRQIDYRHLISKNSDANKIDSMISGDTEERLFKLDSLILQKEEEILAQFIGDEVNLWLRDHPGKPLIPFHIAELAFDKYKNQMLREQLLNFEIICLQELNNRTFSERVFSNINEIRPYNDFNIIKIKELYNELSDTHFFAWSDIFNNFFQQISDTPEEPCVGVDDTLLGTSQNVLQTELEGMTKLEDYHTKTISSLYRLSLDLKQFFLNIEINQFSQCKKLKPIPTSDINETKEVQDVPQPVVTEDGPTPRQSTLERLITFSLENPYLTAGSIGLLVASVLLFVYTPVGLGFAVGSLISFGIHKYKTSQAEVHEMPPIQDFHLR